MNNKEEETRMLSELAGKPACWFVERPAKVQQLLEWQFEIPLLYFNGAVVLKYLQVLRAAGFERCQYCGEWVEADRLVRVPMDTWNPASSPTLCCEGTCEFELLSSR